MENQNYSMYEIITMTPGMASEVLDYEIKKDSPDIELIKNILEHSQIEDVNVQTKDGWSALTWASRWGHTEIVKLLLEKPNILVNVKNKRGDYLYHSRTALMIASLGGRTEIFRMLLERPDIDVNVQDNEGKTALYWASAGGHIEIVKWLLDHPNIDVNLQSEIGENALKMASRIGHRVIAYLIKSHPKSKKT